MDLSLVPDQEHILKRPSLRVRPFKWTLISGTTRSYLHRTGEHCPVTLLSNVVDLAVEELPTDEEDLEAASGRLVPDGFPVFLFLVDTYCDEDRLEAVKTAIASSLEGLPSCALVGLISFDDRIRLYDVKGAAPTCRSMFMLDDVPLVASLDDILPLGRFLAPVQRYLGMLRRTLDVMEAAPEASVSSENQSFQPPAQPSLSRNEGAPAVRGQAYGSVLQAVLQYLKPLSMVREDADSNEDISQCARILSFLSGPPTAGLGSLQPYITSKSYFKDRHDAAAETEMQQAAAPASDFYNQTALVAASLGIVLDLFMLPARPLCLEVLSSISALSGGSMWMYRSAAEAMLTQDLSHHLSALHAQTCLLRLRLPPQLKVSKSYGRLLRDALYEDLYHVMTCDPFETICLDLEHVSDLTGPVAIQVAFQYVLPVFVESPGEAEYFELQKRLRLMTVQVGASDVAGEIYQKLKPEVVTAVLMHKVIAALKAEGVLKAGVLLQDWLIILADLYAKHVPSSSFVVSEAFQPLIRLIYGLLRSPLLLGRYVQGTEDSQVFLEHQWTGLPPSELQKAIYPTLCSFRNPDEKAFPSHSLSRVAMKLSQTPLFVMDAYDTIILFCVKGSELSFPPSPTSAVHQSIQARIQGRKHSPHYIAVKEEDLGAQAFIAKLLDEPAELGTPLGGESEVVFGGYLAFVDWIKYAAEEYNSR